MKNLKLIVPTIGVLILSGCFGKKDANPMNGIQSGNFVTAIEREDTIARWQQVCTDLEIRANAEVVANQQKLETMSKQYASDLAITQEKCEEFQNTYNASVEELQGQIDAYATQASSTERPSFAGILHTFDAIESKSVFYEMVAGQTSRVSLKYSFVAHKNALGSLRTTTTSSLNNEQISEQQKSKDEKMMGTLPKGLSFQGQGSNGLWEISGTPEVDFPNGVNEVEYKINLVPTLDEDKVTEAEKDLLGSMSRFSEQITILVRKPAFARPEFQDTDTAPILKDGHWVVTLKVQDSSTDDQAPILYFQETTNPGTSNIIVIDGATKTTFTPEGLKPSKVDDAWLYTVLINQSLVESEYLRIPEKKHPTSGRNKLINISLNVVAQSRSSGLISEKAKQISIQNIRLGQGE